MKLHACLVLVFSLALCTQPIAAGAFAAFPAGCASGVDVEKLRNATDALLSQIDALRVRIAGLEGDRIHASARTTRTGRTQVALGIHTTLPDECASKSDLEDLQKQFMIAVDELDVLAVRITDLEIRPFRAGMPTIDRLGIGGN